MESPFLRFDELIYYGMFSSSFFIRIIKSMFEETNFA